MPAVVTTAGASQTPDGASITDRRQRYGLLLASTILLLGVQGIGSQGALQEILVTGLGGACLLLALRAADVTTRKVLAAALLAACALAMTVVLEVSGASGDGPMRVMNAALVGLGPPAVALGVMRDLRASGRVRLETVAGVLAFYLLVGMFFAFVYGAIDRLGDQPFFTGGTTASIAHCVYFSFTTLTTVGYGDLVSGLNLGRTLAIFEALLGQIYLVTVVSLIVSNLGVARRSGDAPGAEEAARHPKQVMTGGTDRLSVRGVPENKERSSS